MAGHFFKNYSFFLINVSSFLLIGACMNVISKGYFRSFILVSILALIAAGLGILINEYHLLSANGILFIQVLSLVPGAAALYGQKGCAIETWTRETSAEKLDEKIFKCLFGVGFFLAVLAFVLKL